MSSRILVLLSILNLLLWSAGCGGSRIDERGQRVSVAGNVTLDGSPLTRARILFITDEGRGAVKSSALIEDGAFAIPSEQGPLTGTARVEIHPELIELEELEAVRGSERRRQVEIKPVNIPVRYNRTSELTAVVQNDADNNFTFELFSR